MSQTNTDDQYERDCFIVNTLIEVLDGLESVQLLNGLSAQEVTEWLRKRHIFYAAARINGYTDDSRIPV